MALRVWIGGAQTRRAVGTITIGGTWDDVGAVTLTVTAGNVSLTLTITKISATVDTGQLAANLHAMLSGTALPGGASATFTASGSGAAIGQFAQYSYSVNAAVVTITGPEDGGELTLSTAENSATGTAVYAETVAELSAYSFNDADNWLGATVPSASDDLLFDERATHSLKYGLEQSFDSYATLTVTEGFRHAIGLPPINEEGNIRYTEYRDRYLKAHAVTANVRGGIGVINLNFGTSAAVILTVNRTVQSGQSGLPTVNILGGNATSDVNVIRGDVYFSGSAEYITVGSSNIALGQCVAVLDTVTLAQRCDVMGGRVEVFGGLSLIQMTGGLVKVHSGAVTTINVDGGTLEYLSGGTITTLRVSDSGLADFSRSAVPRTVTNTVLYAGAGYRDPMGSVTNTNGIDLVVCSPHDLSSFILPKNRTLTLSAI